MSDETVEKSPFHGLKVLELTVARAGPVAARQMADWGADVIKVELPFALESSEIADKSFRENSDFQNLTRSRRTITINLKNPQGLETLRRLADKCDVLIENFRPNVKKRLGFDYETLSKRNPRLIYASISGYGQDGPYEHRPGVDQILQGMGGMMELTGDPNGTPTRLGVAIVDFMTAMLISFGIATALYERSSSGKGQWVQGSLLQSQLFMLDFQAARWLKDGEIPTRAGNNHPTFRPTGLFQAKDALINVATVPQVYGRFCAALGRPELETDPRFNSVKLRIDNSDALNAIIQDIIETNTAEYWVNRLNGDGIPCGVVNKLDQVFEDAGVKHLGMVRNVPSDLVGDSDQLGQPLMFSRSQQSEPWGAPDRGQHNEEVLSEFGFSEQEISDLKSSGAI